MKTLLLYSLLSSKGNQSNDSNPLLTGIAKGLGFVVAIGGAILIYRLIKTNQEKKKQEEQIKEHGKNIDKKKLSYSEKEYKDFAQMIYNSLQGYTEDEDAVASVILKMRNKHDWGKLVVTFGIRNLSPNLFLIPAKKLNLIEALNEFVRDDEKNWKKITTHLNKMGVII